MNLILIGIIVFLAIAAGYLLLAQKSVPVAVQPTPTPSVSLTFLPTSTPNAIADQKTYRNEEYGFEVILPKIFNFQESLNGVGFSFSDDVEEKFSISINKNDKKYSLNDWLIRYGNNEFYNNPVEAAFGIDKEIEINGVKALKGDWGCCMTYQEALAISKGDYVYIILGGVKDWNEKTGFADSYKYSKDFNNIISTFKFIEKSQVDRLIYKNDVYGYEFNYDKKFLENGTSCIINDANKNIINIGDKISITVKNTAETDPGTYADTDMKKFESEYKDIGSELISIGGEQAVVEDINNKQTLKPGIRAYVIKNGKVYIFSDLGEGKCRSDYDEKHNYFKNLNTIISTFKFTGTGEAANLKTYSNVKYGFELKYPASLLISAEGPNIAQKDLNAGKEISSTISPSYETLGFKNTSSVKKFEISIFHTTEKPLTEESYQNFFYTSGACDLRYLSSIPAISMIKENGISMIQVDSYGSSPKSCYYLKNSTNNLIVLSLLPSSSQSSYVAINKIAKDLLSTFKFTK